MKQKHNRKRLGTRGIVCLLAVGAAVVALGTHRTSERTSPSIPYEARVRTVQTSAEIPYCSETPGLALVIR